MAGYLGYQRLDDVTAIGQSSFLPAHAQSTRAITELNQPAESPPDQESDDADGTRKRSSEGDDLPALIAFERNGGLTEQDRELIGQIGQEIREGGLRGSTPTIDPLTETGDATAIGDLGLLSDDGEAAFIALGIDAGQRGAVTHDVNKVRRLLRQEVRLPGLQAHVTGPAGVAVDLEQEAADAGKTLVYVTAALVLVLLLVVYRAPLLALVPLVVVAVAYMAASGIAYLLIKGGEIDASSEGTLLLLVLIFGAGTDYSLLLVHRYREELSSGDAADGADAVARAMRATGPSILASGGTVIAAMLCLLLAELESTRWLGPILALGVAAMLAAAFTLLPALLSLLGPRAFWPAHARETPDTGIWERLAALVERRARMLVGLIALGLAVFALGNAISHDTLGFGQDLPSRADSSRGTAIFNKHFTPGLTSPLPVVVPTEYATRALTVLEGVPGVAYAAPAPTQADRSLLIVVLESDPYTRPAMDAVERMRSAVEPVAPGVAVGGVPAENVDIENTNDRDTRLIIPVVLLVVFLILCVSLRALVAPIYLILTVVASFFATLGLATAIFIGVLDQPGLTYNLVLVAFIFLVALGVDYNIFLMGRAREEAAEHGTRVGVRRAVVTTGSVVTGAGVILAGTFATLTLLPLLELVQIGGTVAIGVVLDTFVVRALLVPSITEIAGDRAWWPRKVNVSEGSG